jgi:hypothetical protein
LLLTYPAPEGSAPQLTTLTSTTASQSDGLSAGIATALR